MIARLSLTYRMLIAQTNELSVGSEMQFELGDHLNRANVANIRYVKSTSPNGDLMYLHMEQVHAAKTLCT